VDSTRDLFRDRPITDVKGRNVVERGFLNYCGGVVLNVIVTWFKGW